LAKITISIPEGVVEALAGGDKAVLAAKLKELVINTVALATKINDLTYQLDLVASLEEQLFKCRVEEVPGLTLATIKATRTLLEMAKDVIRAEGYTMRIVKVLEKELEYLESATERIRSGEVRKEVEKALSETASVAVSEAIIQVRRELGVELRSGNLENFKSKLVSTFTEIRILQMVQELRLMVFLAAFHAFSLVVVLIDNLSQVIKMSEQLAQTIDEVMSKLEKPVSLLKSGEHYGGLTLTM